MSSVALFEGDCRQLQPDMLDELPHSIITDPPYGVDYIVQWDKNPDSLKSGIWHHLFQFLPLGGWLLSFAGHRTVHLIGMAIQKAGFEVKHLYAWIHPSAALRNPTVGGMLRTHRPDIPNPERFDNLYPSIKGVFEPIIVARKPLGNTCLVDNVVARGTGAWNAGGARVGCDNQRLPSNVIMTDPVDGLEDIHGLFVVPKPSRTERETGLDGLLEGDFKRANPGQMWQPTKRKNTVVTVKPVALMQHLVRLHTLPGQTVMDPFMGSGTTGCACVLLNRGFIGVEKEASAMEIADRRIQYYQTAS